MIATQDHPPASSPTTPQLSQRESHLLAAFLLLKFDLFKLAEQENLSPQDLLAFADSRAVQAQVATLRTFAEDAFSLRAVQFRATALETLEELSKTTQDPIEKRRAVSTILSSLPLSLSRKRENNPHPTSPPTASSPLLRLSPHPPAVPSPTPHTPSHIPSPTYSPLETAQIVLSSLRHLKRPTNAATLHAFASPDASIFNCPLPANPIHFIEAVATSAPLEPCTNHWLRPGPSTPTSATYFLTLSHSSRGTTKYRLDLSKPGALSKPDAASWLISKLSEHTDSG